MVFSWALTAAIVHQRIAQSRPFSFKERAQKVFPIAVFNTCSIGFANAALTFIFPSLHEMIQGTTPLFTLLSSVVLESKRFNGWAYAAMLPVCGGAALSAASEINFS